MGNGNHVRIHRPEAVVELGYGNALVRRSVFYCNAYWNGIVVDEKVVHAAVRIESARARFYCSRLVRRAYHQIACKLAVVQRVNELARHAFVVNVASVNRGNARVRRPGGQGNRIRFSRKRRTIQTQFRLAQVIQATKVRVDVERIAVQQPSRERVERNPGGLPRKTRPKALSGRLAASPRRKTS